MARGDKKQKKPRKSLKERIAPFRQAYSFTVERDPKLNWILLGSLLVPFALVLALGFVLGAPIAFGFTGFLVGVLVATVVFGRRANRAAYREAEGKPGAALAIVNSLRGDWRVTPVVTANTQQDMVHRVVGRPGVILIAEGTPQRVRGLLAQEKKRTVRVAGDVPVYDYIVGDDKSAGEIPIRKLSKTLTKLPRNISPGELNKLETRMKAVSPTPQRQIPKGPVPKGARVPKSVKGMKVPPPQGR